MANVIVTVAPGVLPPASWAGTFHPCHGDDALLRRRPAGQPQRLGGIFVSERPVAPTTSAVAVYEVRTVEHWNRLVGDPVFTIWSFSRPRAGVTADECERRYRAHGDLARTQHPGMAAYRQHYVDRQDGDADRPCTVVAELAFAAAQDWEQGFLATPESAALVEADIAGYLDRAFLWSVTTGRPAPVAGG